MFNKILLALSLLCMVGCNCNQQKLVWEDNFDGTTLDTTKWSYNIFPAFRANKEQQAYTDSPENVKIEDGKLVITAHKTGLEIPAYTSGRVVTKNKGDWKYCRVEVRAKLPKGTGVWPAIWMLPTEYKFGPWPGSGEIDIMEHVGYEPNNVYANVHTNAYNHRMKTDQSSAVEIVPTEDDYHVYACDWNEEYIEISVDGVPYYKFVNDKKGDIDTWPFDEYFHLVLNTAIGGNWGGDMGIDDSIFPQSYYIDWVRVYQ